MAPRAASMKTRLKKLGKSWKDSAEEVGSGSGPDIDDGFYKMRLTKAQVTENANHGNLQVYWDWEVVDGEFAGTHVPQWNNLEHEVGLSIAQKTIVRLGFDVPDDVTELEDVLEELTDTQPIARCKVQTVEKDGWENVNLYVNKLLEGGGDVEPTTAGNEEPDDNDEPAFAEGEAVKVVDNGTEYTGKVISCSDTEVVIDFDGSEETWSLDDVESAEEPDEPATPAEPDVPEGVTVTCVEDGETYTGTVVSTDPDLKVAVVDFGEYGEEEKAWDVLDVHAAASDDTPDEPAAASDEKDPGFESGDMVQYTDEDDGSTVTGKVIRLMQDEEEAVVEVDGEQFAVPYDMLSKADAAGGSDDDGDEVDVGTRITWEYRGKDLVGTVKEVLDDGVRVKRDDTGRITKVNDGDYYLAD